MKKRLHYLLYALFFILLGNQSFGQAFTATYAFGGVTSGTSGLTDPTPVPTATGVVFGSFSAVLEAQTYAGLPVAAPTNPNAGSRFSFTVCPPGATTLVNTFTGSMDPNQYYTVTITPNAGTSVTLTTLTFDFQRSSTGVRQYAVRGSIDNYGANLPASISPASADLSVVPTNIFQSTDNLTVAQVGSTVTFDATTYANITSPITLHFYGWNAEGSGGTFSIDNVVINGTSQAAVATPTLTATTTPATSPTSIDFGATQTVSTTSAAKTFSLSGTNIPAAGVSLSVAAPYSISTDGTNYGLTGSFTQAQMAGAQTVYVKFSPTVTTATPGTVSITSGSATATVALTGTGAAAAVASLTAAPTSLAFGNVNQGVPSVKTYTLSGSNLGANSATVTATAPYSLSKASGGPFTQTLTFTPAELTATTAPTVYVQFSPAATGAANSSVTNTDPDVTTGPSVTVTGNGVVPVLTATTTPATSPTSIDFGNQTIATSATKSYVLTGANIIAGSTTTVTSSNAAYTVSKTNGSGYATSITFSATEIAAGPAVYVQFIAGTLGATPASISNTTTGTGATSASVTLTGTSVAAPVPLLTLAPTTLTFSGQVGSTSAAQSYTITGANISGASSVTVAAPYSVSKTTGGTYGTTLNYTTADFPLGVGVQTVFVKFSPTVVAVGGVNNGTAINATAGGTSQNVTLNGTGIGVPALTVTGSPLTFSQVVNTTSAAQSFTLSGAYLTANTTLAVAAPYTISKTNGGTYSANLTYSTAEMATAQTVYVQFAPTVIAAGGVNNATITIASTGANSPTVTLNGTGLAVPTLVASPGTIAFGNQSIAAASAGSPFTLTATNTTANTTLTTAAPYGLSKTLAGPYAASISYTPAELAAAVTVYANFAPATTGAANGSVAIATQSTTGTSVTLTGTGIPPPNVAPTLNAITDVSTCFTSVPQTIALSGISPGPEATQTVIVSVTSSNPGLFANLGVLPLTATTAQLNYTFAAGASGTAAVTVSVHDNGGTANGGVDTYTSTFNITINAGAAISITASNGGAAVEKGQSITLTATGGTTYTWTASNPNDIVSQNGASIVVRPGTLTGSPLAPSKPPYTFTVSAGGCSVPQSFTLNAFNATKLVTSNVITPNADGINDTWAIVNIELYPNNNVKVFDKAGKIVFSQSGYLNTWDGTYNGSPLTQGTYYYVVDLGGGTKYSGYISIVR